MAKNKDPNRTTRNLRDISDYYKLNTKAVNDLAEADKSNTPEYSEEELNKYRSKPWLKLSESVKIMLIKAWFAGSVCFFIFWGLGNYLGDMLDMLLVFGIVLGLSMDLLVNPLLRFMEKTPGANGKWMMFAKKSYASFFWNMLYGCLLLFLVYTWYQLLNGVIVAIAGTVETVPVGVEPILFGLFYTCFDMLLIGMKHTFVRIFRDAAGRGR